MSDLGPLPAIQPEWLFIYSLDHDAPDPRVKDALLQLDSFNPGLLPLSEGLIKITLHSAVESCDDALSSTYFSLRFALRNCGVEPCEITEVFARHILHETPTRRKPHVLLSHALSVLDTEFDTLPDIESL